MDCRNKEDVRRKYEDLNFYKSFTQNFNETESEKVDKFIKKTKREIRNYYKKENEKVQRTIIKEYGIDGYIELIYLPKEITDYEIAEEYFACYEKRRYIPSPYDCTGQLFTIWHRITKRNYGFVIYHKIGMDI